MEGHSNEGVNGQFRYVGSLSLDVTDGTYKLINDSSASSMPSFGNMRGKNRAKARREKKNTQPTAPPSEGIPTIPSSASVDDATAYIEGKLTLKQLEERVAKATESEKLSKTQQRTKKRGKTNGSEPAADGKPPKPKD